jgi:hypothetical protein
MNQVQKQRRTTRAQIIEFPFVEQGTLWERNIEDRLQELTYFTEGFTDAGFNLFLPENTSVRHAIEELLVKEAALRWIIRVAKRSTGRARVSLWADIHRVLAGLEVTAQLVMGGEEKRLIRV